MTQEIIFQAFGQGNFRGTFFGGKRFNLATLQGKSLKAIFQVEAGFYQGEPEGFGGKSFNGAILSPLSGVTVTGVITNNGNVIYNETTSTRTALFITELNILALPIVQPPLPPEPIIIPEQIFNICANIFRLRGSTAQGAPPQEKILVSSGCTFSQQQLDLLKSTGHIIELTNESGLKLVITEPVTPQNPFFIKDGVKIFINQNEAKSGRTIAINIKESLGFREV